MPPAGRPLRSEHVETKRTPLRFMAWLSAYERYGGAVYAFKWCDRLAWFARLARFYPGTSIRLAVGGVSTVGNPAHPATLQPAGPVTARTPVIVTLGGNGFWGCMPRVTFDWSRLPADPRGKVPVTVVSYANAVCQAASMIACINDVPIDLPEVAPISPDWFPFVVREVRRRHRLASLWYAPSDTSMWLLLTTDANDRLIVRFDGTARGIDYAAEPGFNLQAGFSPLVPREMREDWVRWRDETGADPAAEFLRLRAPYHLLDAAVPLPPPPERKRRRAYVVTDDRPAKRTRSKGPVV